MTVVADLHLHTTATDGRATTAQVLAGAAAHGLRYAVITDHSVVTWAGVPEAGASLGVTVPFPGTEISTVHDGRRYHLVLYGAGLLDTGLREYLFAPIRAKNALAERVRTRLVARGYELPSLAEIRRHSNGRGPATQEKVLTNRTSIAHHVAVAAGLSFERAYALVSEAYRSVDAAEPADPARRYLPTGEVLDRARSHRLVVSLAHPLWECRSERDIRTVLEDVGWMRARGLDAIETRSYHHRPLDDHPLLLAARTEHGLLASGGSDYHANGKTEIGVGGIGAGAFDALAALVAERTAEVGPRV